MAIIRSPNASPAIPGLGNAILHPKQQYHFTVEYSFDDDDNTLARQTVRVEPRLGSKELVIIFEDDRTNKVVKALAGGVTSYAAISIVQLDGAENPLCVWNYEGTFEDFQFTTHNYATGAAVEIAALFDIDHWDVDPTP